MTWTTDGSGLQVKRIRGRTIPQACGKYIAFLGLEFMRAHRRNRADKRLTRTRRRWDRWADQWIQHRSVQHRTERRALRRRVARLALESTARDMGLEVRPGEFSRDLRARAATALRIDTTGTAKGERAAGMPFEVSSTWDRLTLTVDGKTHEWPPLKVEMDRMLGKMTPLEGVANVARAEDEQRIETTRRKVALDLSTVNPGRTGYEYERILEEMSEPDRRLTAEEITQRLDEILPRNPR